MAKKKPDPDEPIIIKKYANRRLYDTSSSAYVTLDDLSKLVHEGVEFVVLDAKSGNDITRNVLNQIIFEQESHGENLLPIAFLRQLIGFYGDQMQAVLPSYLEMSMDSFTKQQEKMQETMGGAAGTGNPYRMFEEMTRQNMAMFQNAMRMFTDPESDDSQPTGGQNSAGNGKKDAAKGEDLTAIRDEMEALRRRLDDLSSEK